MPSQLALSLLDHLYRTSADPSSARKCIKACASDGYKFAGLQFGKECWCGDAVGGQLTSDEECHNKCRRGGNCGGPCRNFIWGQE